MATGPAVPYPKIAFTVSKDEEEAFATYESLASRIRATNDAKGEITALLREEALDGYPEIKNLITTAVELDDAVDPLASQLSAFIGQTRYTLEQFDAELRAPVSVLVSELEALAERLLKDLEPAKAFRRLRSPPEAMTAVDAMNEILGVLKSLDADALLTFMSATWTARADSLNAILERASADAGEVVVRRADGLLDALIGSLNKANDILQDVSSQTLVLLERLRSDDMINVPLSPPAGLTSRSFSGGWGPGSTFRPSPAEGRRASA